MRSCLAVVYLSIAALLCVANPSPVVAQGAASGEKATCDYRTECFAEWSCHLPPDVPLLSGSATVSANRLVTNDARGPYLDRRDSARTNVRAALNLLPTSPTVDPALARRSLRIDLTHPADTTARSLGIINDPFAQLHAWGTTLARSGVEPTIQYFPVGSTAKSALTHVNFTYQGRYYLLQLGPEALGDGCNRGGTAVYGAGTTAATVSRPRYDRYVVDAPPGSIGRLFDVTNKLAAAVNKGLYLTSLRVVFDIARPSHE